MTTKAVKKAGIVTDEILKKAYELGKSIYPEYKEQWSGGAESNRLMELAFLWGILGYPWDKTDIEKAV